ncbi:MAG: hypothetical protein RXN93_03815 [Thermocladium sp.]
MPIVGFRFRAYTNEQMLRALKAQLRLASEIYNTLRWADKYLYQRDDGGLTLTELRQLALDLPKCGWRSDRDYNSALNHLRRAGWESPVVPVELRPLPVVHSYGQGGARKREAP